MSFQRRCIGRAYGAAIGTGPDIEYGRGMIRQLGVTHGSLAYGVAPAAPHSIFVLSMTGGVGVAPGERTARFGRNRLEVDVCVGEDDQKISRRHGELAYNR